MNHGGGDRFPASNLDVPPRVNFANPHGWLVFMMRFSCFFGLGFVPLTALWVQSVPFGPREPVAGPNCTATRFLSNHGGGDRFLATNLDVSPHPPPEPISLITVAGWFF